MPYLEAENGSSGFVIIDCSLSVNHTALDSSLFPSSAGVVSFFFAQGT